MFLRILASLVLLFNVFRKSDGGTFVVDIANRQFLKDGKPFRYISGDLHYARIHPDLWDDRLKRVRGAGLNAIQVYAPWNLHEPVQGTFDFTGILNISHFFSLAQKNGLYVLFRPGPYICAEWENGGLPWWLLNYDGIRMRTSDPTFINAVQSYFNRLFDEIKPYMYQNGGPVIMVQIENEYGALNACDHTYLAFMRDLIWNKIRDDVLIYTTDNAGVDLVTCSHINGTFPTVDFGPSPSLGFLDHHFAVQQNVSNGGPNVCSEYYITWFTAWGQSTLLERNITTLMSNFDHFYHVDKASWNIYMIHGGTNFGFNVDGGLITSYDYGAPIAENGDITPIYSAIRSFVQNLSDWEYPPGDVPKNNPSKAYGQVNLQRIGSGLIPALTSIQETCQSSAQPMTFEQINHPYGFVLYSTTLIKVGTKLVTPGISDMGYVFVNNNYQGWVKSNKKELTISSAQPGDTLRILVENVGRADHWRGAYPTLEKKGLFTNVTLDGTLLQNWVQCGINLTEAAVNSLTNKFFEEDAQQLQEATGSTPGVFAGQFTIDVVQDTWLNSTGWGKGQLFINGYNLGRYWPLEGPQMTLYVPSPLLKQKNTVLMVELMGAQQSYVNLVDKPIYVYTNFTVQ